MPPTQNILVSIKRFSLNICHLSCISAPTTDATTAGEIPSLRSSAYAPAAWSSVSPAARALTHPTLGQETFSSVPSWIASCQNDERHEKQLAVSEPSPRASPWQCPSLVYSQDTTTLGQLDALLPLAIFEADRTGECCALEIGARDRRIVRFELEVERRRGRARRCRQAGVRADQAYSENGTLTSGYGRRAARDPPETGPNQPTPTSSTTRRPPAPPPPHLPITRLAAPEHWRGRVC